MTQSVDGLDWLFARQRFGVHVGLERVRALLEAVGLTQPPFRVILVGGTNGKGSTSATLSAILQAAGLRTGLFTSPHLSDFRERFLVDGQMLPVQNLRATLDMVRSHAEALEATFFEIVVVLGVWLFAEAGVDIAVMEVGLGGRLDATNALEPELSIITNIALDHTEILGNTIEAIAAEKAGILCPGRAAVTGARGEALPVLQAVGADTWVLEDADLGLESLGLDGWRVHLAHAGEPLLTFNTPLLGEHGARNAALAALAAWRLGASAEAIGRGAAATIWPGRMERVGWAGLDVLLDGAHNPDGAAALARAVRQLGLAPLPIVFGAAGDKDIAGVAQELRQIASQVILTQALHSPRAATPEALAPYFAGLPVTLAPGPQEALRLAAGLGVPRVLVCGSLYLIGEVRPLLLGQQAEQRERWQ